MIWESIRSVTLQRLEREFLWKYFWTHNEPLDFRNTCHKCGVPETLEHIALDCDASGQNVIWNLTKELWSKKYDQWPKMNWGLILGCNLVKFKSKKNTILQEKARLFTILVSIAWHLIWNLRVDVAINGNRSPNTQEIHTRWLNAINRALQRDRLLTDKTKFGAVAFQKQLILNTWSGLLENEESLPDDWTQEGLLVGMRPKIVSKGVG
ncbi:hypothetical protein C8R45DRAFT_1057445 [Mycena sanguinolenta]|nr:hypothetical protein C8R45DRAFT_1057445 [Mycena sanguinolenta]